MDLRIYQQHMVDQIGQAWAAGKRRVLGVMPTGAGKTEVAIALILRIATPKTRVLVLVERKNLAHQWRDRLRRHGADYVGLLQAENTIATAAPILVATIQTLKARGIPEDVALVVLDESHIWYQHHDTVLAELHQALVLGLSATPLREGLGLRFEHMVVGATIRELTAAGYLVPARTYAPAADEIERALQEVAIRAGDFALGQLSAAMRGKTIMGDVVGTWKRRAADRSTIAFCVDKTHARELAAQFCTAGAEARVVLDETGDDERAELFAAFDRRQVQVLCSVGVLAVGFDSPVASCAILARPTCSLSLYVQQGGRVLRPYQSKTDALILDHAGNTLRHGRLEDFQPPSELSGVDRHTDKKGRSERAAVWICRHCEAINVRGDDCCIQCGEPRLRLSAVVVVDGELREVEVRKNQQLPGPTPAEVCQFHRMAFWHAQAKGLKPGWAYYATLRKFRLSEQAAHRVLPRRWEPVVPIPPDDETARWLRADWQCTLIARRKASANA